MSLVWLIEMVHITKLRLYLEHNQQKPKSKQNITRAIEVTNNLTIARGSREGTVGRRVFRNYYKGHVDKTKGEGGSKEGRWVWLGWRGVVGGKMQTTVIEQ